jgi:protein TonB
VEQSRVGQHKAGQHKAGQHEVGLHKKVEQLTYSTGIRSILVLPVALILSLVLFTLLSDLTSPESLKLNREQASPELDFLLVRQESEVELRSRLPPPPEEISEPEAFTPNAMTQEPISVDMPEVTFDMPSIDLGIAIDMSSALANVSTAALSTQMFAVDIPFQDNLRAIKDIAPRYPSRALRRKIEGRLVAEFLVDAEGYVKEDSIKFVEANPEGVFEKEVIRSLKRSRFDPMDEQGKGLVYRARKAYNFKMPH